MRPIVPICFSCCALAVALALSPSAAQIETVESSETASHWTAHGRIEGHLALNYSPAGAFSPDSTTLAILSGEKVLVADLKSMGIRKILRPRIEHVTDLQIQSANYLTPNRLLILASGLVESHAKGEPPPTPQLFFQWDSDRDALFGKVNSEVSEQGFGAPRYFPDIRYVSFTKINDFDLWDPLTGRGGRVNVPALTRPANLYAFSPDGHWLLVAQIESSSTPDPVVVRMSDRQFADALRGHQGTVLSLAFSRDGKKLATSCEDGKVRLWSVPDWKLLRAVAGHVGPVHWVEFSPDGKWLVSGGEDKTVRIWSAEQGTLAQTLEESQAPVLTVAFSPNGRYLAASSEKTVLVWERIQ